MRITSLPIYNILKEGNCLVSCKLFDEFNKTIITLLEQINNIYKSISDILSTSENSNIPNFIIENKLVKNAFFDISNGMIVLIKDEYTVYEPFKNEIHDLRIYLSQVGILTVGYDY